MKSTLSNWQRIFKDPYSLIVQGSAIDGSDSWQTHPIGMSYQYVWNFEKGQNIQIGNHTKTVLSAIHPKTDSRRRPIGLNRALFINNLEKNGIHNELIDHKDYFNKLPDYKFVISPEGNGIDCHRHYEALIAGCIPICEFNPLIEEKYKGCPILYTKDYSEINEDYLNKKYEEMKDIEYDFSRLFLSYYDENHQQIIKLYGNFWTYQLANSIFYKQ